MILINPLSTAETARAGLDLYFQERGERPVVAVLYTHSHVDHYAGVKGVITRQEQVDSGKTAVLAPEGFMEAAVSENVYAGNAMTRRVAYPSPAVPHALGQVDVGLGKAYPLGAITLIAPTDIISQTGETRVIDGVEMEFQIVSGTEAPPSGPYTPAVQGTELGRDGLPLLHNILTLRGAQVRGPRNGPRR